MADHTRRSVLKTVGGTALLTAGGVGTAAARGHGRGRGRRQGASAENTLFDIVEASDDFDVLELALETAGLDDVLDARGKQYTVFAPTDAAFEALLEALGVTAEELLARDDLGTILLYHVTNGRRYASSVVNAPRIRMLTGDDVWVDGTTLNDGQASIVGTDVEASNGVAHVIDGVLLPP
jgi:uncharacterized surface protein with fasciclin (FAS1) repeats